MVTLTKDEAFEAWWTDYQRGLMPPADTVHVPRLDIDDALWHRRWDRWVKAVAYEAWTAACQT